MVNKKNASAVSNRSLKKVIVFFAAVVTLIILSICIRLVAIIRESTFDGTHRFSIAIQNKENSTIVLSVDPFNKTVTTFILTGDRKKLTPARILGIPIDGLIQTRQNVSFDQKHPEKILLQILLNPAMDKKHITAIDLLRLFMYTKTRTARDIIEKEIVIPASSSDIDTIVSNMFSDETIVDEKVSIELVNATNTDGLGKRLERIIENSGGNVIALSNARASNKKSIIYYYGESSYTLKKLQKILQYPVSTIQTREVADIKIIIGEDGIREDVF